MLIISREEVQQILTMEAAIETTAQAYIDIAQENVNVPQRHHIKVPSQDADMLIMSGLVGVDELLSVKIVSLFPHNPSQGLPATVGSLMLINNKNGLLEAVMDATYLTAVRTGAASAVATRSLARTDAAVLGLLGAGSMSFHQVEAVLAVRPINKILINSRTLSKVDSLITELRPLLNRLNRVITVEICPTAEEVCHRSDVICACTTSVEPVVRGEWLRPGTHVNATGAFSPNMQEIDEDFVRGCRLITVDIKPAALLPGDLARPISAGIIQENEVWQLGDLLLNQNIRTRGDLPWTMFKSVGVAAQDVLCGWYVYSEARRRGLGKEVAL